jgi:outer membrane protein OmpA-like peptidoglycan-associated protein
MAERVKVYEEQEKKGSSLWAWLFPLLLLLLLAVWFFTRDRHEATTAATPVTDAPKPDTGAGTQATTGWTSASIADALQSRGRVGFGDADVHFATGSAALAGDSQAVLDSSAQALKDHGDWKLRVVGHTDSTGSSAANNKLAQQRATSVMAYLVAHGVDQSRLSVDSKGDSEPAANNATGTGRADNRRVELIKQ